MDRSFNRERFFYIMLPSPAAPHFTRHNLNSLCISRSRFSTSASSQQSLYQPLPIFDQRIIPAASVSTAPIFDQPIISAASVTAAPHFRPDTSISIKLRHGIVVLCVLSVTTSDGS